jgi:putative addiction module killer protein
VTVVYEIRYYLTAAGKNVFESWLESLSDDVVEARIDARINRLTHGNFGDCKPVGGGVWELRIDWGPGYRVYYAVVAQRCVLLLAGGDKRKQSADIAKAIENLKDYKLRSRKP